MIRSMTGYGRGENSAANRKFTVEIKSVNHRYNDISVNLPKSMNYMEHRIKKSLSGRVFRGKTDVYISFETYSAEDVKLTVNLNLGRAYVKALDELKEGCGISDTDKLMLAAKFQDVITSEKLRYDEDVMWAALSPALEGALGAFISMREREGDALKEDILLKAERIKEITGIIKERAPFVAEEHKERLLNRIKEALSGVEIDPERIAIEAVIFADKSCIDEEITRLLSHISQLEDILKAGGTVGRKLDFLIQEMNREANTIGSKSNDLKVTQAAIELKSEIEKVREQVQNIE